MVADLRPAKIALREKVDRKGDEFVKECLEAGFDAIVAIESEGMAVLMPHILTTKDRSEYPLIVPDNVISKVPSTIQGKRVLVFDASAMHGRKLAQVSSKVEGLASEVERAVMVIHCDYPTNKWPDRVGMVEESRTYGWAKERIIERILQRPFPLDGDHLAFSFTYKSRDFSDDLINAAARVGWMHEISPPGSSILRLTVDNVKPILENLRLLPTTWLESVCKVRLYVDKKNKSFTVLPIVYPALPDEESNSEGTCVYCEMQRDWNLLDCVRHNNLSGETCFRSVALNTSLQLGEEFVRRFIGELDQIVGPDARKAELELSMNMPEIIRGCWPFSFQESPEEILTLAYRRIQSVLDDATFPNQMALPIDDSDEKFRFHYEGHDCLVGADSLQTLPWKRVFIEIGKWYNELRSSEDYANQDFEALDAKGISYSELCSRLRSIPPSMVSASLDALLDEGMLRPRVVRTDRRTSSGGSSAYWVRGYTTGGEYVRTLALGMAERHDRAHGSSITATIGT